MTARPAVSVEAEMTEAGRGSPDSQQSVQGPLRRAPSRERAPEASMMDTWDPSQSGRATVPPRLPGDARSDGARHDRDGTVSAGDEPHYGMPTMRARSDTEGAACWSAQSILWKRGWSGRPRVLSLSNRPFPQDSVRTRGNPAGLRYSALGAVHRTLAKRQGVQSQLQGGKVVLAFGRSPDRPM